MSASIDQRHRAATARELLKPAAHPRRRFAEKIDMKMQITLMHPTGDIEKWAQSLCDESSESIYLGAVAIWTDGKEFACLAASTDEARLAGGLEKLSEHVVAVLRGEYPEDEERTVLSMAKRFLGGRDRR